MICDRILKTSNMNRLIALVSGLALLFQTMPVMASSPAQVKSKSFMQWCQDNAANSLSKETSKTVSILLRHVKTIDCKQADSRLKNLTSLDLSGKQISDIQVLGSLSHLTSLNLTNNQIADLRPLRHLTKLKKLILTKNKIGSANVGDHLEPISALYELRELYLDRNELGNIDTLSKLRLKKLKVSGNNIDYEHCPIKGKSICIF
jgi:internalin A